MIKVDNISFKYQKSFQLFDQLSIELKPGNIYGLLGKNGAGKTTLLKILTGLLYPQSGNCTINNTPVGRRIPAILEDIYFLPEEYTLPGISLQKFAKANAFFYKKFSFETFYKFIEEFELNDQQKLNTMSYGQKKKFLMAFGLGTNAKFLVMDEPTNGLDIPSKSQFRKIMASTIDENRCFIISTHQVRDLENLIDPVVAISNGKIIFNESIENITSKLCFGSINNDENLEVLYSEGMEGKQKGTMVNPDGRDSTIDLELLFNAIMTNKEKTLQIFNN